MAIPVIDLFAGPGGLGEGFSALSDAEGDRSFQIALSIEKESNAHETLTLRSFFRQFRPNEIPAEYYQFLRGEITKKELFEFWPDEAAAAQAEAWQVVLGDGPAAIAAAEVDHRIREGLAGEPDWLLIGGPPCQAYSVVGRSRRQETVLDESKDERVGLYKQYLRILAFHNPAVFIMENVKGMLSAKTAKDNVFEKILADLRDPATAYHSDRPDDRTQLVCPGYKIYSLVTKAKSTDLNGDPVFKPKDFIIRSEKYGIPQCRHRVILLGIRNTVDFTPEILNLSDEVPLSRAIFGLPRLRSGLSKSADSGAAWREAIGRITNRGNLTGVTREIRDEITNQLERINMPQHAKGADFVRSANISAGFEQDWFLDPEIGGVCNHNSRSHMDSDLLRYFFAACFARINRSSPRLGDLPVALLPDHENVETGISEKKFADRFRVQLPDHPAKTITSHISKDGHYYIHFDPTQCRSFTVREAARVQTFPDNYYFCGSRTAQFAQVGNAVPPLLANRIARIVLPVFEHIAQQDNA